MSWKPVARLCGICGLSLAVVCGEEKAHLHVDAYVPGPGFTANLYTATTSAAVLNLGDWFRYR